MTIKEIAEQWAFDPRTVRQFGETVVVTTSCLYPSMSAVSVNVEGGVETVIVNDGARAVHEASGSGARFDKPASVIKSIAKSYGLDVLPDGTIRTRSMRPEEVGAAIVMVANASRDAANALLNRYRPMVTRDAKELVRQILYRRFAEARIHPGLSVPGASSKNHRFDYVVDFENGRRLLLDIVVPDASSINAAVVASMDVSAKRDGEQFLQRIVYDDAREWKSQDLALLNVASGKPVQLSSLPETIDRLAA